MKGNDRLYPSVFHTRYVVLSQLRDKTVEIIKQLTADNKTLLLADFGCGDMPYREVIEPMVGKYLGIDLEMNPKAEHHIDFDSKTTLPDNYCDIVLSNQVLEHVDSPSGYLQEAMRILKPGGTAIITTHGYWFYHPTPNDYWRWTSAGLRKTIEAEDFKIHSFFGILGLAASGLQLLQDGIALKLPKFLIPPFALVMQTLIRLFNKINSQPQRDRDGALYVIVAQKPL
ncbi:class I SAM-dependent methyltransferase [Mucilaginibacter sp. CAU 1740]|uniref:class I SAM-dependent methyltransferase n=1 Tax=Mucilaginibacter sp. CAU 1740 TaxID=3140365 RepID=UPI00325B3743